MAKKPPKRSKTKPRQATSTRKPKPRLRVSKPHAAMPPTVAVATVPPLAVSTPLDAIPATATVVKTPSLVEGVRQYAQKHFPRGCTWWACVLEATDDDLTTLIGRARTPAGALKAVWNKRVLQVKTQQQSALLTRPADQLIVQDQEPTTR